MIAINRLISKRMGVRSTANARKRKEIMLPSSKCSEREPKATVYEFKNEVTPAIAFCAKSGAI
ncbi:MAG: hypothetical protein J6V07_00735, partial [Clostridia bacterium]|nr:hypothetical protein [Clostridia bacterium]